VPRKGEKLHRLVHAIERAIANASTVQIEAPKRMPDKHTRKLREHDVVLTFTERHHEMTLAIECRDRSRPVGVPDVEQFYAKCQGTGIDQGVMVSSLGFTSTAIEKAAGYNIGCLSLDEAQSFDWCTAPALEYVKRDLINTNATVMFTDPPADGSDIELEDGTAVTTEMIARWMAAALDREQNAVRDGEVTQTFIQDDPPLYYTHSSGRRIQARRIQIVTTYRAQRSFVPLEFRRYVDVARKKPIVDAAIAAVPLPDGRTAELILQKTPDGPMQISLVPRPEKLSKD
jgi:hypothetical protein